MQSKDGQIEVVATAAQKKSSGVKPLLH